MNEITRDAIVSIGAFAAIFGICYVYLMTRNRERMRILEKNIETSPFRSIKFSNAQTLKYGMLLIGLAVGILMGGVLKSIGIEKNTSYLSMISLFGGISLIANYLIVKKQNHD